MFMPSLLTAILSLASPSPQVAGSSEAPDPPALVLAGRRILHVGAHPDDESTFAPMLAEACRFNGARCHLVVAQDADSWGCLMGLGLEDRDKCSEMRRMEVSASAANLNATHEFFGWREGRYNWNDAGVESNLAGLAREQGGRSRLVDRFMQTLESFRPEVVLAFDPRHGTTCHPNHRAVVRLLLEAVDRLEPRQRPEVWFGSDFAVPGAPEEIARITDGFGIVRWPGDRAPVVWYDMTAPLPDGRTAYDYLVDALRLNATQFGEVATGRLTPSPDPSHRRLPLVRRADIDPAQAGLCEERAPGFLRNVESMPDDVFVKAVIGR
ncbi:PIG-L family deacetylase [Arenimonas sp.]|uniref:PIG-L family deacetylase n=1 Tax=Arenimonas sp. TaxID=1872635 RepID=UPI0035AFAD78